MSAAYRPKTLQFLIKNQWLVDSILGLGSGYQIHLVYLNTEIAPEVRSEISGGRIQEGVLGEIVYQGPEERRRVAAVEVTRVNDFESFVRFDLRLLEVTPFLRDGTGESSNGYLCYYLANPA